MGSLESRPLKNSEFPETLFSWGNSGNYSISRSSDIES